MFRASTEAAVCVTCRNAVLFNRKNHFYDYVDASEKNQGRFTQKATCCAPTARLTESEMMVALAAALCL